MFYRMRSQHVEPTNMLKRVFGYSCHFGFGCADFFHHFCCIAVGGVLVLAPFLYTVVGALVLVVGVLHAISPATRRPTPATCFGLDGIDDPHEQGEALHRAGGG